MRGCRHSGVRVIVPPRCASSPTRITCRYVRPQRTPHPPPLMEGEALASRLLELGPVGARFLGPVIIEVPHFASLRGKQREIVVLRSDNGETWKEHTLEANEEAIQDVLNHSFDGEELSQIEDLHTNRITRILTNDFPHYFAVVSRIRQEVHAIGPDGGTVSSSAVPLVQAVFPPNALTKKIRVGLQAQAIEPELVSKLLGHGVAVSPIVTVEPRRRKFHKAITLSMPAPRAHSQGMINQYSGSAPTLRLLCSITGGQNKAIWEDVTGSTPLTFVKDCVSFTTTVSARFWLMDCRNVSDAARMATDLYTQAMHVPFMAKFVVFAKRVTLFESRIRVFCMTDDKEDKTLEHQEHFVEIAKSRDIEVLENKDVFMEFAGNLVPVLQSGEQPRLGFKAFRENRLAFTMRLRDVDEEPLGRIVFMSDSKVAKGEPTQTPLCTLNLVLPKDIRPDRDSQSDLLSLDVDNSFLHHGGISKPDTIHRADFRLSDICNLLDEDWVKLAAELDVAPSDIALIQDEYPDDNPQQAMIMFRLWLRQKANKATGNKLELALKKIGRQDIVSKCICNVELVTDDMEKALAKVRLDQSGFDTLKDELGSSRDASLRRDTSLSRYVKDSRDELDITDTNDFQNLNSTNHYDQLDNRAVTPNANHEVLEELTQQLTLQSTPKAKTDTNANTPPSSPADFNIGNVTTYGSSPSREDLVTSTPVKVTNDTFVDPIAVLKKNVSDTLTFLHQERNDFLPEDDIIIPSRKDDHISTKIDLDYIQFKPQKRVDDVIKNVVENEVADVIKKAEEVVNEKIDKIEDRSDSLLDDYRNANEDSLDNLESLKDDSISTAQERSEEAFRFLENEISAPPTPLKESIQDSKSAIPVAKPRQKVDKEKDIDLLFSYDGRDSVSPTDEDLLSKIPIKGGKVKTIKKHSKDPLKEFVKLSQDVNWDDSEEIITEQIAKNASADPIVKTTPTRITSEPIGEKIKTKIPVLHTETLSSSELNERYEVSPKSKIPILRTETTRISSPEATYVERTIISPTQVVETTVVSPGSKVSTKSSTLDSDTDDDSPRTPPLKGILKKTCSRTVGSSSGSDVALHEEGAELSESETEDLYQQDQPHYTETVIEEVDPITGAKITRTIRTVSQTITSPSGVRSDEEVRQSMQDVLDHFMSEERTPH